MNYLDVCAAIITYGVMTILALFVSGVLIGMMGLVAAVAVDLARAVWE